MVCYGVTLEMLIGVTIPWVGWWSLQERNENLQTKVSVISSISKRRIL